MSNFWPSGIDLSDTQSPREILEVAKEDWYKGSEGVMELVLQDSESESGYPMIIVHAKHVPGNRTSRLLSVVHQLNNPYPVLIQPETENLPNSLKKSYYRPGLDASAVAAITGMRERTVSNPWVSDTPSEFRKSLAEAFNLGDVKGKILNLAEIEATKIALTPGV